MISAIIISPSQNEISLRQLVDALLSARILDIVIVVQGDDKNISDIKEWFGGKILHAGKATEESLILKGLEVVEQKELHGIMICQSDQKLRSQAVFVDLLHLFWTRRKKIIMPLNNSKREFPVIVSHELFDELRKESSVSALPSIIEQHPQDVLEVEMTESGIVRVSKPSMQASADEGNG
jgi:CTP:molybdopterin cytidylyltransferase MocA